MRIALHRSGDALIVSEAGDSNFSWLLLFENENTARHAFSHVRNKSFTTLTGLSGYLHNLLGITARYSLFPLRDA